MSKANVSKVSKANNLSDSELVKREAYNRKTAHIYLRQRKDRTGLDYLALADFYLNEMKLRGIA